MTIICAHRGASGHAPENTLAALEQAINQGATMAEIDAQLTADGHPVLIHDETLERTTSGSGLVAEHSLAELRQLDVGSWFGDKWRGETIPTLEEAIAAVGNRLTLNIELKGAGGTELEEAVVKVVQAANFTERCVLTSFDHVRIDRLAALDTDLKLGYIIGRGCWRQIFLTSPVHLLSLERSLADAKLVATAHQAGKEIHVWTVNEEVEMKTMMGLGVDAIITNYPDRMRAIQCSK